MQKWEGGQALRRESDMIRVLHGLRVEAGGALLLAPKPSAAPLVVFSLPGRNGLQGTIH